MDNKKTFEQWVRTTVKEGSVTHTGLDGSEYVKVISHENIINNPENNPSWVRIYNEYKNQPNGKN